MLRLIAITTLLLLYLGCARICIGPVTVLADDAVFATVPATATSSPVGRAELTLADLLIAAAENPRVHATYGQLLATIGDDRQRLLYPNPRIGLESEDIPASGLRVNEGVNRLFLAQSVVIGDRLHAARQLGQAETAASTESARVVLHDLQSGIRRVYVELAFLTAREQQLSATFEDFETARRHSEERAAAGASAAAETTRIQVERELLGLERENVLRRQAAVRGRLETLLGVNGFPHDRLRPALVEPGSPPDAANLRSLLLEHHPRLLQQRLEVSVAEAMEALEQARRVPDLDVDVAYGRNHAEDEDLVEFGISVPLPIFDRRQGYIEAARGRITANRSLVAALERELVAALHASLAQLKNRHQALRRYDEHVIPVGNASFAQATQRYRAGKTSLLDLLDAQRTQAQIKQNRLITLYECNLAWGEIQNLTNFPVIHAQTPHLGEETP